MPASTRPAVAEQVRAVLLSGRRLHGGGNLCYSCHEGVHSGRSLGAISGELIAPFCCPQIGCGRRLTRPLPLAFAASILPHGSQQSMSLYAGLAFAAD